MAAIENDQARSPDGSAEGPVIDEAMLEMGEFIVQVSDFEGHLFDPDSLTSFQLEEVDLSMPVQLDLLVQDDGEVTLGSSPPLYYADTTIMPVFHQMKVKIRVTKKEMTHGHGLK